MNNVYITDNKIDNGMLIFNYSEIDIINDFRCIHSEIRTLKNCPSEVAGIFDCSNNLLTSLEYAPKIINGYFDCSNNLLTSLEHCPDIIYGHFECRFNQISSLKGIGKEYCFEINGFLDLEDNPLTSNILGLLKIKGLKKVLMENKEVEAIINSHLRLDRDIVKCKQELIDRGFKEYAKL